MNTKAVVAAILTALTSVLAVLTSPALALFALVASLLIYSFVQDWLDD